MELVRVVVAIFIRRVLLFHSNGAVRALIEKNDVPLLDLGALDRIRGALPLAAGEHLGRDPLPAREVFDEQLSLLDAGKSLPVEIGKLLFLAGEKQIHGLGEESSAIGFIGARPER